MRHTRPRFHRKPPTAKGIAGTAIVGDGRGSTIARAQVLAGCGALALALGGDGASAQGLSGMDEPQAKAVTGAKPAPPPAFTPVAAKPAETPKSAPVAATAAKTTAKAGPVSGPVSGPTPRITALPLFPQSMRSQAPRHAETPPEPAPSRNKVREPARPNIQPAPERPRQAAPAPAITPTPPPIAGPLPISTPSPTPVRMVPRPPPRAPIKPADPTAGLPPLPDPQWPLAALALLAGGYGAWRWRGQRRAAGDDTAADTAEALLLNDPANSHDEHDAHDDSTLAALGPRLHPSRTGDLPDPSTSACHAGEGMMPADAAPAAPAPAIVPPPAEPPPQGTIFATNFAFAPLPEGAPPIGDPIELAPAAPETALAGPRSAPSDHATPPAPSEQDAAHGQPLAAPPTPAPIPPAPLVIAFEATRFSVTLSNAILRYRLTVTNRGPEDLGPVSIAAAMASAPLGAAEEVHPAESGPLSERHRLDHLAPGERLQLSGQLRVPLAALAPARVGPAALFLALIEVRADAQHKGDPEAMPTTAFDAAPEPFSERLSDLSAPGFAAPPLPDWLTGGVMARTAAPAPPLVVTARYIVGESPGVAATATAIAPFRLDLGPQVALNLAQRPLSGA